MSQLIERNQTDLSQLLAAAARLHAAGRLAEADRAYRQLLARAPGHVDALHMLGALLGQRGEYDAAIELIRRAILVRPAAANLHITLARNLKAAGKITEAISAYRRAVEINPTSTEALNNLGVALRQNGELEESRAAFEKAIGFDPKFAEAYNNLASVLCDVGKFPEALAASQQAIALRPAYAEALNNRGNALAGLGKLDESIASFRQALALQPDYAEALNNLGIVLKETLDFDESVRVLRKAISLRGWYAEAHNNLGNTLRSMGNREEAIEAYRHAIVARGHWSLAWNNLAVALWEENRHAEALSAATKAVDIQPDFAEGHNTLGNVLRDAGDIDGAVQHYRAALCHKPDYADAMANLSVGLKDQGRLDEALAMARQSIATRPNAAAHSNLIYLMHFHPDCDAAAIAAEQDAWQREYAQPFAGKTRRKARMSGKIRVGYIGSYFRNHVVGLNILPLLRQHDRTQFEVFCYSDVSREDDLTRQFRHIDLNWRDIAGKSNAEAAALIEADELDLLIDLSLHMAANRLGVMARRPAPVQATFAGYPAPTGVRAIDFRITDEFLDPSGIEEGDFEKPIRLSDSFWCYDHTAGLAETPEVAGLPALASGHITFGCLNNFCKVNDRVLSVWAAALRHVPDSRLLMLCPSKLAQQATISKLQELSISKDRIEFVGHQPRAKYLRTYDRIDIALDTFPYNGHTTSLDALFMGVPVVTLAGKHSVARAGVSQLSNLGLPELIAISPDEFVSIAAALAGNVQHLSQLRRRLRGVMQNSPLMDATRFARNVEHAYRAMISKVVDA
jgi:predicted O-linked N-acetylglucosamine transferase (SPINDLY family)